MNELVWSIKIGDLDIVKSFVEGKEIDINKEINGRPPLLYAADFGQKDVIEYLVSKGADVNAKDKHGITALLAAIWEGHTLCVRALLDKGADKTGTAPDGTSYVDAASLAEIKALLQ